MTMTQPGVDDKTRSTGPDPRAGTQPDATLPQATEPDAALAAACLFHGLADSSRVAILRHLLVGEHNVRRLTEHLGLAQSTVSSHLACLRDCGLVTSRPVGRSSVFSVTEPLLVTSLFAAAERVLAATGDAVVLCPETGSAATR
ncbi:metalloregulator ArsR/SmtB family transcription factor [uncultured Serinicoccus sp.]|uniref:ArsR/SmtB family transcription factor n=1 Tax=uncultured Serinicoccus sp. TaxID=735514 RepID=UPI00261CBBB4|nr:metalloregulator ArsR/SmtB family transcription factor [uncultured Serinicoccus sp.]